MSNNHLTYFKVENFKKFDSLEVNDIGQFNLIVGDNNVGKTCFLEALLFDEDAHQLLNNFYIGLTKRGFKFQIEEITVKTANSAKTEITYPKDNYFNLYINKSKDENLVFRYTCNDNDSKIIINVTAQDKILHAVNPKIGLEIKIKSEENNGIKYLYEIKKIALDDFKKQFIDINKVNYSNSSSWIYDYNLEILNFPLISFNDTPLEEETIKIYESLKTKQEKEILINSLKVINDKIIGVDFRGNFNDLKSVFLISYEDQNDFFPLNYMGDGFKRIFYIVLKMISLKGKRIMIDEIEIGIHHSKILEFWKNIIQVCRKLDVQLFATTHSQECIDAFSQASKDTNEKDIRLIRLQENKDKSIKAICYKEDYIEYLVESSTEER
jgi:AAA15 family ATPase/GTPase